MKGNFPYVCTRVKARKALLLSPDWYQRMLLMSIPELSRALGETRYKKEMQELAAYYSGIDLLEYATYKNLARDYRSILGYCRGKLHSVLKLYLSRWDVWNIKTLLRGKLYKAGENEIRSSLVPAGSLPEEFWEELLKVESPLEIVELLSGTPYHHPVMKVVKPEINLGEIENELDRFYYLQLLEEAEGKFLEWIRKEIDVVNLRTVLRLKREGMAEEKIFQFILRGGRELSERKLRELLSLDFSDFLNSLKDYSFWEDIKEGVEKAKNGSMNELMRALEKHLILSASSFSYLSPLSILPVIDYLLRKKNEIDNIRIIARGKELGLPKEEIESQLV